ncbi:MAG: hypothetical protein GX862_03455 [Leucobacter sp.]|nr:hypothetical protein [Leucobacter sp.]
MTTSLTERYIAATVRTLPANTQADVQAELRASITDDIEARTEQGESVHDAEREVLTTLGDPDILAASYADRPLHLLGPKYYLTWWRLLKLLWAIVPVTAAIGVLIGQMIVNAPVGEIVGSVISVAIGAIVHTGFWTTLVFAILERTGTDTGVRWSPDQLPEPQTTGAGRGELIASLIFLGIAAAALLWDHFIGFVLVAEGELNLAEGLASQTAAMPVLNPDLWPVWIGVLLVLILLEASLAVAVFASHGWTRGLAVFNTTLGAAFITFFVVLLATTQLINPDLVQHLAQQVTMTDSVMQIVMVCIAGAVILVTVWDVVDGWRKARR